MRPAMNDLQGGDKARGRYDIRHSMIRPPPGGTPAQSRSASKPQAARNPPPRRGAPYGAGAIRCCTGGGCIGASCGDCGG